MVLGPAASEILVTEPTSRFHKPQEKPTYLSLTECVSGTVLSVEATEVSFAQFSPLEFEVWGGERQQKGNYLSASGMRIALKGCRGRAAPGVGLIEEPA